MFKMGSKTAVLLMLLGAAVGGLAVTNASAKTFKSYPWKYGLKKNKVWTAPRDDAAPLYYTNTKKNGYIWNRSFTKKLHNIKNYQYTSWYAQKSFKRNGKVYYQVTGNKVSGYVWHGYLTPAISKQIGSFKSDSSYINYLENDKSQKLSRAVLKYFPGATVSLDLSRRGAGQFVNNRAMTTSNYTSVINLTSLSHELKTSYGSTYSETMMNTLDFPITSTNAHVAKEVNSILVKNGYTQKKIKGLINQGYKLGIYINGGTGITAGKKGYPWTINTNTNTMNTSALYLAK
ncbi:D-alanyl-D-alanine carboxypeptidase [Levilactobacillus wangkuiensis]|uniref:D-alanyl-D-alanine carboxypeptidase n=1 Tax=Levilactobacillus wangkuiensis TaxID=2799566 RepID=UPI00194FA533|nr:D-alanyl-D-alanine carboxypeptidase [Levilactobacillus wangkuiensis]